MKELSLPHIVLIYLAFINVVTFFVYGIDKWKAKKSLWRIREASLLILAILGGSIGAWLEIIEIKYARKSLKLCVFTCAKLVTY